MRPGSNWHESKGASHRPPGQTESVGKGATDALDGTEQLDRAAPAGNYERDRAGRQAAADRIGADHVATALLEVAGGPGQAKGHAAVAYGGEGAGRSSGSPSGVHPRCYEATALRPSPKSSSRSCSTQLGVPPTDEALRKELDEVNHQLAQHSGQHQRELQQERDTVSEAGRHRKTLEEEVAETQSRLTQAERRHAEELTEVAKRQVLSDERVQAELSALRAELVLADSRAERLSLDGRDWANELDRIGAEAEQYRTEAEASKARLQESEAKVLVMRSEMHSIRSRPSSGTEGDHDQWQGRRTQKLDKLELRNMQQQRDEEIRAKLQAEAMMVQMQADLDARLEEQRRLMQTQIDTISTELATSRAELKQSRSRSPGLKLVASPDEASVQEHGASAASDPNAQGWVMVPKVQGVRKGWRRVWLVLNNGLAVFHAGKQARRQKSGMHREEEGHEQMAEVVLDLRQPNFSVTDVVEADVIHANSRDVPRIFKLAQIDNGVAAMELLVLVSGPRRPFVSLLPPALLPSLPPSFP